MACVFKNLEVYTISSLFHDKLFHILVGAFKLNLLFSSPMTVQYSLLSYSKEVVPILFSYTTSTDIQNMTTAKCVHSQRVETTSMEYNNKNT